MRLSKKKLWVVLGNPIGFWVYTESLKGSERGPIVEIMIRTLSLHSFRGFTVLSDFYLKSANHLVQSTLKDSAHGESMILWALPIGQLERFAPVV